MRTTRIGTIASIGMLILLGALIPAVGQAQTTKETGREMCILPWPAEANWRPQMPQESHGVTFVEFLKGDETFENWSEIGSITRVPLEMATISVSQVVEQLDRSHGRICTDVATTILAQDTAAEHPWIIFQVTCPHYANDAVESNIYLTIRGDQALFTCQRGMKTSEITPEKQAELVAFFKGARLAHQK